MVGLSAREIVCPCFGFLVALAAVGLWVYVLADLLKNEPSAGNDKVVWLLVVILLPLLGSALYLLIRKPQRIKETGR